uniref:Uncharacterized protein n=1 Tax=Amphimedon queenslandica TaxID=400682 RepID=A0A1X7TPI7_AMPQE
MSRKTEKFKNLTVIKLLAALIYSLHIDTYKNVTKM